MATLRATVRNGRLIVDEATSLPEGSVLDLVVDDEGDDLGEEERKALDAAISAAWRSVESGQARPAADILSELRGRE